MGKKIIINNKKTKTNKIKKMKFKMKIQSSQMRKFKRKKYDNSCYFCKNTYIVTYNVIIQV